MNQLPGKVFRKKILITGSSSLVGTALIKNLAKTVNLKYQDISIKPSINDLQNQSGQIIIPLTDLKNKIN